jgi:hypothetical protein
MTIATVRAARPGRGAPEVEPAPVSGSASARPQRQPTAGESPASVTPILPSVVLDPLPEPVELLVKLQELGAERPASSRVEAPRELARWAVEFWGGRLPELGVTDEVVLAAFESGRREIWLWVTGDRRWSQLSSWLAARVSRRATGYEDLGPVHTRRGLSP